MSTKHTTGPWNCFGNAIYSGPVSHWSEPRDKTPRLVAQCPNHEAFEFYGVTEEQAVFLNMAGESESQANAKLISAAPELLEAAKAVLSMATSHRWKVNSDETDVFGCLKAAIKKAEGTE